jgi:adenosylcobinamide-phosphate guanylyltransferase
MIDHVLTALDGSRVEEVSVVTTPATPATREHVETPVIETPGDGYVEDLDAALAHDRIGEPVLTVAADVPLLSSEVVDRVLAAYDDGSLTVAVPVALKAHLGVSVDATLPEMPEWAPTGLNVVGAGPDRRHRSWDARLSVNVNRPADRGVVEALARPRKN